MVPNLTLLLFKGVLNIQIQTKYHLGEIEYQLICGALWIILSLSLHNPMAIGDDSNRFSAVGCLF